MTPFRSLVACLCLAIPVAAGGYAWGIHSYPRNLWPLEMLREFFGTSVVPPRIVGTHDAHDRLVAFAGKTEVPCPVQTADTSVILAIGQSNAANHGAARLTARHPDKVLNVFAGKCYAAASPLLGATGEGGEFLTPLGDRLIDDGTYKTVVILASAITDTPISRWQRDGDLNEVMLAALRTLPAGYKVTQIVWHQGENDLRLGTSARFYQASFRSLLGALRDAGVDAPVFIAVATKCGASQRDGNEVAKGQRGLVDDKSIFLGADTDALLEDADRQKDRCHLSESGQKKIALSYAAAIEKAR